MLRPRSAAVVLPLLAVLLAGCAGDPQTSLRDAVADVVDEANARDAGGLRGALSNLRAEIDGQVRNGDLPTAEATRLLAILQQLEADAALLDAPEEPSPSPTPSPTPEETEEEPEPSPTPEETEEEDEPEPEPTQAPEPTEAPEPAPTEILPSPAATSAEPSASASPAQAVRPADPAPSPSGA